MERKTTDDFFIVLMPARDGRAFIDTVTALMQVGRMLGREPLVVSSDGLNYWDARNNVMAKLRKALRIYGIEVKNPIRALCIDNDILIDEPLDAIASAFRDADATGKNLIANYRTAWEDGKVVNTIMIPNGDGTYSTASEAELYDLKCGVSKAKIAGGLGFYYGFVPIGYEYRIYPPYKTEDIPFYLDNRIDLVYTPLKLLHNKNVML